MANHFTEHIARILRVDKNILVDLENRLGKVTGKSGVFEKIYLENEKHLIDRLWILGLNNNSSAHEVYDAIISKVESDDLAILKALKIDQLSHVESAKVLVDFVGRLHPPTTGFFLKYEKAAALLEAEPPKEIL